MDHQVTFQGRTCCSAAGKVASKELPAVSSSGSALPAESHLTWSYVLPWAACLQPPSQAGNTFSSAPHYTGQGYVRPESITLLPWPNPAFFPLPFTVNVMHPKLRLSVQFQRPQCATYVFFITFSLAPFTTNLRKMLVYTHFLELS